MIPSIWDAVRFFADKNNEPNQFILTGSALPSKESITHTGTGRIAKFTLHTMSLSESG